MSLNALILIIGGLSVLMRVLPGVLMRKADLPLALRLAMPYVPITLFTAMIACDIFFWEDGFNLNPLVNLKLIASLVAIIVAYWTKDLIKTVLAGVLAISLLYLIV
ncbi:MULTISPECIES: AzlD domain-containing protein [Aerococcus]|uniref:AzlD domain-containing protein n=1 Tax=Aerococcus sanguinicola TaxID=119206 RepID=A0A5N1GNW2_9LACT|nr:MULTISPECIES: AzlD domain-containing protein [Aerococcus]KAA9302094.1 AzlD domain-containing protein [Aerococcus sanguinicola]MDK6368477.1 AzlD domain-containing protein [Aerococcus sp. UMB9870]MDK6679560.1 AzlD domain-containing protein [Aerococcus sp. UMB8608]MDK6686404.1 AzlD domain-containing protein [Aerococcus sp. UMB8623]MDK6940974.1 AzlD domain-containing protein [Aerococcus sp. UMB8487]